MKDYSNLSSKANFSNSTADYSQNGQQVLKMNHPSENRANSTPPASLTNRSRVYSTLLSLLQNKQILNAETKKTIPFMLHAEARRFLQEGFGWRETDIRQVEYSIIRDVEGIRHYEIVYDAPFALYNHLQKENSIETIFESGAVAVPGQILNHLICRKLLEIFSEKELLAVPGFTKEVEDEGKRIESLRLDLDAKLARQGFLMPVIRNSLIINIKVFRHPNDEKPFMLRTRNLNKGGQNRW